MSKSRRDLIRMTDEEVDLFTHSQWSMVLGTSGPTGWPHLVTMGYGFLDGCLAFQSYAKSQKVVNIQRDPHVSCLIEVPGEEYGEIKGVLVQGHAVLISDRRALLDLSRSILFQRMGAGADDVSMPRPLEEIVAKRIGVKVVPERIVSWDHARLNGRY